MYQDRLYSHLSENPICSGKTEILQIQDKRNSWKRAKSCFEIRDSALPDSGFSHSWKRIWGIPHDFRFLWQIWAFIYGLTSALDLKESKKAENGYEELNFSGPPFHIQANSRYSTYWRSKIMWSKFEKSNSDILSIKGWLSLINCWLS